MVDDPALTNRYWPGKNPLRLVLDSRLRLPAHLHLFDGTEPTIVFNTLLQEVSSNLQYQRLESNRDLLPEMLSFLYQRHIQSILVEGGARLIQTFLDLGVWDELRVITSHFVHLPGGIMAPAIPGASIEQSFELEEDHIAIYRKPV